MSQCRNTHPVYGRCSKETGHEGEHYLPQWPAGKVLQFRQVVQWYDSDGYEPSETDEDEE